MTNLSVQSSHATRQSLGRIKFSEMRELMILQGQSCTSRTRNPSPSGNLLPICSTALIGLFTDPTKRLLLEGTMYYISLTCVNNAYIAGNH